MLPPGLLGKQGIARIAFCFEANHRANYWRASRKWPEIISMQGGFPASLRFQAAFGSACIIPKTLLSVSLQ